VVCFTAFCWYFLILYVTTVRLTWKILTQFQLPNYYWYLFCFTVHISYISILLSHYFHSFSSSLHHISMPWHAMSINKLFLCHYHELWCPTCEVCDCQQFKDAHSLRHKVQSELSASFQQLHNAPSECSQVRCN